MREILKSDGKKALVMNDEPPRKRPGPDPITTGNVNPLTREERRAAMLKNVETQKKIEAEKKAAQNAKG